MHAHSQFFLGLQMPQVYVQNKSSQTLNVFVSKYNGSGSDEWFTLNPEQGDHWTRDTEGWELVAFRVGSSVKPTSKESRAGVPD